MRDSQFAGTFYEKDSIALEKQLTECFEGERGPGALPAHDVKHKKDPLPLAIIAPHAGYAYSGACAAWSYKALGDAPVADVYIILAPSHKADRSGLTLQTFQTPLGMVRVDQDLAKRLLEKGSIKEDDELHAQEHSIEVQLPLLQFAHKDEINRIKILPILVGSDLDQRQFAIDLKEALIDAERKAVIIVSTDFTHYGRHYHYLPFTSDIQENLSALDQGAIEFLKAGDPEGLLAYIEDKMATICGAYPLALLLRLIRPTKIKVEQYYTSSVVTKDDKNSVSYASILFY